MPIFRKDDPDFFGAMNSESMRWTRVGTRALGPGWDFGSIVMADEGNSSSSPIVSLLQIPPGGVLPRHAHACHRVEVVVRGSIDIGEARVLGPGDVSVSKAGEFYGPHVAGPEGSVSVEIFSSGVGIQPIWEGDPSPEVLAAMARAQAEIERAIGTTTAATD